MQFATAGLDEEVLRGLAAHYAAQVPASTSSAPSTPVPSASASSQDAPDGATIVREGISSKGVPACDSCHGDTGRNPLFPRLAGQPESYLVAQLKQLHEGGRGGTAYAHLMETIAGRLSDEEIAAAAAWYASR
ncbi:c-type cytochrome [Methylobrevis pamukkalensis]|uniref:Cytochrome c-552 n=1 Tax=Methylobrevis pamukkalensis TaxID=1439726 RepID=A0A1E3H505_9HYPH|nr:c-type cytochrome [Methylobrevis pamukkalensis]ODN71418.1 Cytochrome c-552 precursor [Methylobrevis pamukkalensis]